MIFHPFYDSNPLIFSYLNIWRIEFFYRKFALSKVPESSGCFSLRGQGEETRRDGNQRKRDRGRETEEERQRKRGRGRESAAHKFFEKLEVYRFRQDLSSKAILKPRAYDHAEQVKKLPPE